MTTIYSRISQDLRLSGQINKWIKIFLFFYMFLLFRSRTLGEFAFFLLFFSFIHFVLSTLVIITNERCSLSLTRELLLFEKLNHQSFHSIHEKKNRIRNYDRIKTYELELDQWTEPYNYCFKLESIKGVYEMYTWSGGLLLLLIAFRAHASLLIMVK